MPILMINTANLDVDTAAIASCYRPSWTHIALRNIPQSQRTTRSTQHSPVHQQACRPSRSRPSQASTKTDVNPLLTAEGGTVQPLGMHLRQCTMCGMYFGNWVFFRDHIYKYHSKMLVTCKFCQDSVFSPVMSIHIRQSHTTCFNCLKVFASDKLLQEHRRDCRPSIKHAELLERVIILPPEPQQPAHQQAQPPAPPIPAPVVPQQDVPEQAPEPVLKTAPVEPVVGHPGRPHVCKYCDRDFRKLLHMHMHQSQKHRDKVEPSLLNNPVTCDQCDKEFASQADLEQHADKVHPAPEPELTPAVPEPAPTPAVPEPAPTPVLSSGNQPHSSTTPSYLLYHA